MIQVQLFKVHPVAHANVSESALLAVLHSRNIQHCCKAKLNV